MPQGALAEPPFNVPPSDVPPINPPIGDRGRFCIINKSFYSNGAINPENDCQRCQVAVDRFGWTNLASGTACGDPTNDECTNPDTCDGSGTCLDNHEPTSTTCGDAGTECTNQDYCDGNGGCTDNGYVAVNAPCGDKTTDTQCDKPDTCDGAGTCLDNYEPTTTTCGDDGTECTNQDYCDGNGGCTDNGYVAVNAPCGDKTTDTRCDNPDTCDANGTCLDNHEPTGTTCGDAGTGCTNQDYCDGNGACHDNGYKPSSTVCRAQAGGCDVAEYCTGSSEGCPGDAKATPGTVCRAADGPCDVAESCDGASTDCPADAFASSSTLAFPTRGVCDSPDFCSGTSKLVPLDVTNAGAPCRPAAGLCDVAEICQVGSDDCPADVKTPAGTDCGGLVDAGACELFTCRADGTCTQDGYRAPSASCRAPADAGCDQRDRCGVLTYVCAGDLVTPCTTNSAPDDGKCQVNGIDNGRCVVNPYDANNRTDFTSAWGAYRIPGTTLTIFYPPANGGYLTEFENYPDCGPDAKQPEGTDCTYTPLGPDGAGRCLNGVCNPLFCKNTIECPDGSVCGCPSGGTCPPGYCIPAPVDHGYGDACTGVAGRDYGDCTGYLCCAGMEGDGNGAVAGAGATGRCAECCSGLTDDCGGDATCCDGECTDVTSDPRHCTGCNYDGGIDCETLINACNPSVVKCDAINIGSGCVMEEYCEPAADAAGWQGWECDIPQERLPNPACDYCVFPSATPGKPCLTDAECGGWFPGSCFRDPSLFCFAMGVPYATTDECREPPFDGCTPACFELDNAANVGATCESDSECFGGTTCKTTCDLSYLWLTAFCFSDPTCQW